MSGLFDFAPREVLPFDGSAVLIESFIQQDTADILFTDLMTEIPWQSHQLVIHLPTRPHTPFGCN